jgi:hypothetical protein
MPVTVVLTALKAILDGLVLPGGCGALDAYITPPNPRDAPPPAIYLWSARGPEKRQSLPRNQTSTPVTSPIGPSQAGWKEIRHSVDAYLTWFGQADQPDADTNFPRAIDGIMMALRTGPSPLYTSDPATGVQSDLVNIGEEMTYQMVPPRAAASQRLLRYDCLITIQCTEFFQA